MFLLDWQETSNQYKGDTCQHASQGLCYSLGRGVHKVETHLALTSRSLHKEWVFSAMPTVLRHQQQLSGCTTDQTFQLLELVKNVLSLHQQDSERR